VACEGGSGTCIKVSIAYPWKDKPVVPEAPGLGLIGDGMIIRSEAVVQIT